MTTIRLTAITKHYGRHQVLQDVTLSAKPGRVTALLGPNGSGKTTTIKVLLGLTRANAGSARFDDLTYAQLPRPSASVGVLLESSGLHPGMTAQQHLHIAARAARAPLERIDQVLATVGLNAQKQTRIRRYSLGMKQRVDAEVERTL
ncbi:MAG TPA: ATP-binding cassette domain-containing protein [Plantibacter sp.]|uniref:ATP-binding cassette domain-containing protein n=1 Tax=Plantibacter sp. TaxID=1871045 RepID=UPI002C938E39|nr:ATP-binding cassette domain-containing protein [Plantibacter sp.]